MTTDKVYLVGFMACGKSTVARALSARLGWRAEDIDDLIEARERRSIADIFARQESRKLSGPSSVKCSSSYCPFGTPWWRRAAEPSRIQRIDQ